jgi:hypothetical protein
MMMAVVRHDQTKTAKIPLRKCFRGGKIGQIAISPAIKTTNTPKIHPSNEILRNCCLSTIILAIIQ